MAKAKKEFWLKDSHNQSTLYFGNGLHNIIDEIGFHFNIIYV